MTQTQPVVEIFVATARRNTIYNDSISWWFNPFCSSSCTFRSSEYSRLNLVTICIYLYLHHFTSACGHMWVFLCRGEELPMHPRVCMCWMECHWVAIKSSMLNSSMLNPPGYLIGRHYNFWINQLKFAISKPELIDAVES